MIFFFFFCYTRSIPNLSESMEIAVCAQSIYISEHIIFLIKLSLHLLGCLTGYCRQSKNIQLPGRPEKIKLKKKKDIENNNRKLF